MWEVGAVMMEKTVDIAEVCRRIQNSTTHFNTLGVSVECSQKDVRNAYRAVMKVLHPDTGCKYSQEDLHDMIEKVQEAYKVLKDNNARRAYRIQLMLEGKSDRDLPSLMVRLSNIEGLTSVDTFKASQEAEDGEDISVRFEGEQTVLFDFWKDCGVCKGTGIIVYDKCIPCPQCNGRGVIGDKGKCLMCYGVGYIGWIVCRSCVGRGRVKSKGKLSKEYVKAHPDWKNVCGVKRRVITGAGNKGHLGGRSGDLIVVDWSDEDDKS